MKQTWSIVVFCYNESGTIRTLLDEIARVFDTHLPGLYEIIAVDDGSSDGSAQKMEEARKVRGDVITVIRHEKNRGIGETLRDGYRAAKNENITAVPADGQFDIQELIPYLSIPEGTFISFYRLENVEYTKFRTILSAANKKINLYCNGINLKDVNWVKIYKTRDIKSFPWVLRSSLIESEICAKLLLTGRKPREVLSYYHPRVSGISKGASFQVILRALSETLTLVMTIWHFKKTVLDNHERDGTVLKVPSHTDRIRN